MYAVTSNVAATTLNVGFVQRMNASFKGDTENQSVVGRYSSAVAAPIQILTSLRTRSAR
jgi:hypothetical protein